MELFKDTNFDFLGKKWPFIIASLVLTAAGLGSIAMKGGIKWGIDFTGGALMYVRFSGPPPVAQIRSALAKTIAGDITVQGLTDGNNEVIIGTELKDERELDATRRKMLQTLETTFAKSPGGQLDFTNASQDALITRLREPLQKAGAQLDDQKLQQLVKDILDFRNQPPRSGLITGFDQLSGVPGVTPAVLATLKQECFLAPFAIRQVEIVGPKVARDLRTQAVNATLLALGGMLVYIAFRFEWIYGVAAVIAVFHDVLITVGLFSIFDKEVSLTVIAALLTLVGYSMNDTIVIFDRIRENLKLLRREKLESIINKSVNQTLSRTALTSGLTFLTVLALWLFGGPVLNGFSFAMVVGILIGTYSSVFVASPIVVGWQNYFEARKRGGKSAPVPAARVSAVKPQEKTLAKKAK
ncbi:MAG: protein translocase subunit SecF [Bryobacteraceae bacterium]